MRSCIKMGLSIFIDSSGGPNSLDFCKETGESFYEKNLRLQIIRLNTWQ